MEAKEIFSSPAEHRVDSFRELGTVGFIDATRINPDVLKSSFKRFGAAIFDLLESSPV
jgi:hypothetical protein